MVAEKKETLRKLGLKSPFCIKEKLAQDSY